VLFIFSTLHVDLFLCGTLSILIVFGHITMSRHTHTPHRHICLCLCGTSAFTQFTSLNIERTRICFNYTHIFTIIIIIIIIIIIMCIIVAKLFADLTNKFDMRTELSFI